MESTIKQRITAEGLSKALEAVSTTYLGNGKKIKKVVNTLDKHHSKVNAITELKTSDKRFVHSMLEFVNGSLRTEFGVSITKKTKHSPVYVSKNKYFVEEVLCDSLTYGRMLLVKVPHRVLVVML
jgi:hypothetical protein